MDDGCNPGSYAGHDPGKTARAAGLIWAIYGIAILAVTPVAAGGRATALIAGLVVGLVAIAGGAALVRRWTPRYGVLLSFSYAGVIALVALQLLYGSQRGHLVEELYLGIALGTASIHPPRRTAGVLAAIAAANILHQALRGWTPIGTAGMVMNFGIWLMVAMIASRLVAELREQRSVALVEEAHAQQLATTDALTGLGNRRRLLVDLELALTSGEPIVLALFDLNGFKAYNDTFGHPAGDTLLHQLGLNLTTNLAGHGLAYRMGGDEFCVLTNPGVDGAAVVRDAERALNEHGEAFTIGASFGAMSLPAEAATSEDALRGADKRMYAQKAGGRTSAGRQSTDVLLRVLRERSPDLRDHVEDVTSLCNDVAQQLNIPTDERLSLLQAAALHDVGKAAIPDAILTKPGPLDDSEWAFMHQHTIMGERIMSAAPALARAAQLVRSSHERIDGTGYPDGLAGDAIPLGSRVIAVCDAFDAMISDRPYRPALGIDLAAAELRLCAGTQFDSSVVEALCRAIESKARPAEREGPLGRDLVAFS
ncbi:MAG: diguanylate cyclase and metal dependent phosphohydrolase [Solirubrobacteraceae bacterium]|nr:diguanylate cyclase and metal dependent phosphohydrolase [Solirubrobacteraceae bacterium]